MPLNSKGHTLVEILISTAILGLLAIPLAYFFSVAMRGTQETDLRGLAQTAVLSGFNRIETDLRQAVLITHAPASGTEIEFRLDASADRLHTCTPPDDDGDAADIVAPTERWRVGFNIADDDDNDNLLIDLRCRIRQTGDTVTLGRSIDEGPWNDQIIAKNVPVGGLRFTYFGSISEPTGAGLDRNGDSEITFDELDVDRSGSLNESERLAITGIVVVLATDPTHRSGAVTSEADLSKTKFWIKTRISPILLPIRARS